MTSAKHRRKARRRAEKLMDEAWEYLGDEKKHLADKLSERAVQHGLMNARLWFDRGRILLVLGRAEEADVAFANALEIAPDYEEARRASEARATADGRGNVKRPLAEQPAVNEARSSKSGARDAQEWTRWTAEVAWESVRESLLFDGAAVLPGLLSPAECTSLVAMFGDERRFEHAVVVDDARKGRLEYRFFRNLPDLVIRLRREMYARLAPIANDRCELLNSPKRFPVDHQDFVDQCRGVGQWKESPILLRYPTGGFNGLHRDLSGEIDFPFQLAVTLGHAKSPPEPGGALQLVDQKLGRRRRVREVRTTIGDGVLFATRERLVRIGGAVGLMPVQHGVTVVKSERHALGIPFHDLR